MAAPRRVGPHILFRPTLPNDLCLSWRDVLLSFGSIHFQLAGRVLYRPEIVANPARWKRLSLVSSARPAVVGLPLVDGFVFRP